MESGKEKLSANSLFCLWAHKFSNRTMLSWVLNYMDSCILELPCSWYIHTSTSLGWFREIFCFFVLCILILKIIFYTLLVLMLHGKLEHLPTWWILWFLAKNNCSYLKVLIRFWGKLQWVKGLLPAEERTCSFWLLLILEYAYFIDFLISCYKT